MLAWLAAAAVPILIHLWSRRRYREMYWAAMEYLLAAVRRSRRRFWKSENDADKLSAYNTLYECLVTLSKLMAPFTPFLAEELYQNLNTLSSEIVKLIYDFRQEPKKFLTIKFELF